MKVVGLGVKLHMQHQCQATDIKNMGIRMSSGPSGHDMLETIWRPSFSDTEPRSLGQIDVICETTSGVFYL